MAFKYTPDQDSQVHHEGAIRLMCAPYQSHENGLPEWLKNSSDAYSGTDIQPAGRVIVVVIETGRKSIPASISCLDFVGMTSRRIEEDFRIWADPDAARRGTSGAPSQGGHGNGGKCYMTQMFDGGSLLFTVKGGKGCRYGVAPGTVKFGYVPDREEGRDFNIGDSSSALAQALREIGVRVERLPPDALAAAGKAQSFTLLSGFTPKGYGAKMPIAQLVQALEEHPHMFKTLELCGVYVMVDGEPFESGRRLALPPVPPLEGGEQPRCIAVPGSLRDPQTGLRVSTDKAGTAPGELTLLTSAVRMTYSKKHRHIISYHAQGSFVGFTAVNALDVQSPYRDRIYGSCRLDATSGIKQNERGPLAESPLRRALEHWISQQVQAYAKEFELRDRQRYNQEEKIALSKMNQALDQWKNRLLKDMLKDLWGPGGGPPPPPPLPSGKVKRIDVRLSHENAGLGVAFRPTVHFFDAENNEVRTVPFRWQSLDNNVAMVDDDLMVVTTFSYGKTEIWAETQDGRVTSNRAHLEVVPILAIRLEPSDMEMQAGTRKKIEAICKTPIGELRDAAYLIWTESDSNVARVSAAGQVFAFSPGTTEITAGDDKVLSAQPAKLIVVASGNGGSGGQKGAKGAGRQGFPLVQISGIDPDPDTHQFFNFSREDPPVSQRPQDVDRNIWWINSSAPLAALYLSSDYGYKSREWRIYHLERYIDVLVQIALVNSPSDQGNIPVGLWINKWGAMAADIQSVAVGSLRTFIDEGTLPGGSGT